MKVLRCRDVGFECDAIVRAETEQEVLDQAAEHARERHGFNQMDAETVRMIRSKIQTV